MSDIVIPYAPECNIQLLTAIYGDNCTPDTILCYNHIREHVLSDIQGEIDYSIIMSNILCMNLPFYAVSYGNTIRIIVPHIQFCSIIHENSHLSESNIQTIQKEEFDVYKWVKDIDWYKQEPLKDVDVNEKGTRNTKKTQKVSQQQRGISNNPPSREGDTIFWY